MQKNKKLYDEIDNYSEKYIYYKKIINFKTIKNQIERKYKSFTGVKRGIVALDTTDKIKFLTRLYSCNKAGLIVFISNVKSHAKLKKEKIKINYTFHKDKLIKIFNTKKIYPNDLAVILKTSGSTDSSKYVYLSNSNISFVASEMNKEIFKKKKNYNEFIFAPIDHAFALGRIHSIIKSKHSMTLIDDLNFSNFYDTYKVARCNSISIPSKLLNNLMEMDFVNFKRNIKNLEYAQVSTGYFPKFLRKKFLDIGPNLFINYGMTEAMRTSFLNCKKFPTKIHTEGKPFKGIKIKILKNTKKKFGQVFIKGKNLVLGYSNKNLWKSKIKNGWFRTGDLGSIDKDGFFIFHGRDVDNINVNGINYNLKNVENEIKNFFKIPNIKILNITKKLNNFESTLYLFIDKKINSKSIYLFLRKNNFNISFKNIIFTKEFIVNNTGKISINNLLKKINEK